MNVCANSASPKASDVFGANPTRSRSAECIRSNANGSAIIARPAGWLAYHSRSTLRSGQTVFVIRCRQCRKTFYDCFGTAFYDLKIPEEKVQQRQEDSLGIRMMNGLSLSL